jgi:hypothetical protein
MKSKVLKLNKTPPSEVCVGMKKRQFSTVTAVVCRLVGLLREASNKETPSARLYDHFKNPPTEARWGGN